MFVLIAPGVEYTIFADFLVGQRLLHSDDKKPSSTASGPHQHWLAMGSPKGKACLLGRIPQLNPAWVYCSHIARL
jgi:hypothetical protein